MLVTPQKKLLMTTDSAVVSEQALICTDKKRACWPLLPWNLFWKLTTLCFFRKVILSFWPGMKLHLEILHNQWCRGYKTPAFSSVSKNNQNSHGSICLDQLQDVWTVFIHKEHFLCQVTQVHSDIAGVIHLFTGTLNGIKSHTNKWGTWSSSSLCVYTKLHPITTNTSGLLEDELQQTSAATVTPQPWQNSFNDIWSVRKQ